MLKKIFYCITVVVLTTTVFCQTPSIPKNIILLIGDGMGLSQVSVSALSLKNDQFKKFIHAALVNTCPADNLITDSAASATAYATGQKTDNGKISVDVNGNNLTTIVDIARQKKMSTGIVATCSLTNATPAAFISHDASRKNEFAIAEQILKCDVDFLAGAGTDFFLSKEFGGKRDDNKNLIDSLKYAGYVFYNQPEQLTQPSEKKVCAMFSGYSLPWANQRNYTLGEITKAAIEKLKQNNNGFFLMVEGSQIDWADDQNNNEYFISEMIDFNSAIEEALKFAEKDKNTLVIVTSDHDTGSLGISGKTKKLEDLNLLWATTKHTANLVGLFGFGPGSELFNGIMENNIVGQKLIHLIDPKNF